ncbi:RNA-directed DNA polymerase, eukaryota [Tanacetum coccineum]
MGDFNDVRTMDERLGSSFNVSSARCFDRFIVSSGLVDVKLEGYSFTWSHPSASKMSKLDRFLVTEGIISLYPSISALCLDRHLSDHRPILLREVLSDFGPTTGFLVQSILVKDGGFYSMTSKNSSLQNDLISIDKDLERGNVSDDILLNRMDLNRRLQDIKLCWRSQLSIRGVFVEGTWCTDPSIVKEAFKNHFEGCLERGENKSPGPDGYTFEFFRKYWSLVGADFCDAVDYFFKSAESHLFYADDAMFIGEWSEHNLHNIVKVLNCFHLASGLKINIAKSQVLGVRVSQNVVLQAANGIGCAVLNTPFRYLGVTVGECMSQKSAWVGLVNKLQARLSKWKVKTLSIGGRLTLLKSVLGASPIYYMSIFKVPKGVLKTMESIRSKFFNGVDSSDRKISWVAWDNVLASKLNGGLGVSSFFALNSALLLKWVWRFISGDGSCSNREI